MMTEGKRFSGLILVVATLGVGYCFGDPQKFATLATTLGLLYAAYVAGQTVTDVKENGKV